MHALERLVTTLAHSLPLEVFVFVGSFLEEVIAPVPSPSILVIAGSFGAVQGYTYSGLALLVLFASIGKTLGGLTMYFIANKLKDAALAVFGRHIDLTEEDIDRFGARFTGKISDYAVYIFFRSVPIIPSILLSFGSGVIKLPIKLFVIGTFIGTLVRDTFYIIVGYQGTEVLGHFLRSTSQTEDFILYLLMGCIGIFGLWFIIRKQRHRSAK